MKEIYQAADITQAEIWDVKYPDISKSMGKKTGQADQMGMVKTYSTHHIHNKMP